jgi:hypothetical protein
MESVSVIIILIVIGLLFFFVIDPILDGLGGFGRNLVKKAMEKPDTSEFRACHACGQVSKTPGKFCPHCGAQDTLHVNYSKCGQPYFREACGSNHALIWAEMQRLHSLKQSSPSP